MPATARRRASAIVPAGVGADLVREIPEGRISAGRCTAMRCSPSPALPALSYRLA